ncbi:MAG: hypothetical protein M1383_00695 [Patescibacteria group bacterium]|nr:hypothetical protein [Patescibacteria group bacterium]
MPYIIKQKLNLLADLAGIRQERKKVLVAEPEEYLLGLYAGYLAAQGFEVERCNNLDGIRASAKSFLPDLMVLSTGWNGYFLELVNHLAYLKNNFSGLPVVTVGYGVGSEQLKQLMLAGISGHLDRRLTKPQDIAHVVKAVLNY